MSGVEGALESIGVHCTPQAGGKARALFPAVMREKEETATCGCQMAAGAVGNCRLALSISAIQPMARSLACPLFQLLGVLNLKKFVETIC